MTVCVAAIFNNSTILGACDRMLGVANIQFQPAQAKIWQLTSSIVAMPASNNVNLQYEIHQEVVRVVNDRIASNPKEWWQVKEVANLYRQFYQEARIKRIEEAILFPRILDRNTYIQRQKELSDEFMREISSDLVQFELPRTSILLAGNDGQLSNTVPHLYVIEDGEVSCHDVIGFAAIGSGRLHAGSQFMFDGYTRFKEAPTALFNVLWAKKRSEVAQGVGPKTDMFTIGPFLGSYFQLPEEFVQKVERLYEQRQKRFLEFNERSRIRVKTFLDSLQPPPPASQPPPVPPPPSPEKNT